MFSLICLICGNCVLQSTNAVHWTQCVDGAASEVITNWQRWHDSVADLCRTVFYQRLQFILVITDMTVNIVCVINYVEC